MAINEYSGVDLSGGAWDILRQMFAKYGLTELDDVLKEAITSNGATNTKLIAQAVRGSEAYQKRFKGNIDRVANGYTALTEGEFLYQERSYQETMAAYNANDLAKKETFDQLIANDVSANELSARFNIAYDRVNNAVNSNDKAYIDALRTAYPGIETSDIAKTLLLGKDGSQYLDNKFKTIDINAAENEVGIKSSLGADFLASKGLTRTQAAAALSKTGSQLQGITQAASTFGENPADLQSELEKQNALGQTSTKVQGLASKARAQMQGIAGTAAGTIGSSKAGQI